MRGPTIYYRRLTRSIPGLTSTGFTITCIDGDMAVGGGVLSDGSGDADHMIQSGPVQNPSNSVFEAWRTTWFNGDSAAQDVTLYVVCARGDYGAVG